ncbi:MAG: fumarate hydratase, partial [Geminicoccales bacterium]
MTEFAYQEMFPLGPDETAYRRLTDAHVARASFDGAPVLRVDDAALELLAFEAFKDVSHLLRPGHLQQLRDILDDSEASE